MNEIQKIAVVTNKDTLNGLLKNEDFQAGIKSIASKYMTSERLTRMALLAASRQPRLFQCTVVSFMTAFIKSGELGLDCGGATGQASLVPFKNGYLSKQAGKDIYEAVFIPGYQGLIELAYRGKATNYIDAQIVYANDSFKYNLGSEPMIMFEPNLEDENRGDVKCAFAVIRLNGSQYPKIEIMTKSQLLAIKARSRASSDGPWVTDEAEMMRKTVLRRALKYIPKTPEIEKALEADNKLYDFDLPNVQEVEELSPQGVKGVKAKLAENGTKAKKDIKSQIEQLKQESKPITQQIGDRLDQPSIGDDIPWDGTTNEEQI